MNGYVLFSFFDGFEYFPHIAVRGAGFDAPAAACAESDAEIFVSVVELVHYSLSCAWVLVVSRVVA